GRKMTVGRSITKLERSASTSSTPGLEDLCHNFAMLMSASLPIKVVRIRRDQDTRSRLAAAGYFKNTRPKPIKGAFSIFYNVLKNQAAAPEKGSRRFLATSKSLLLRRRGFHRGLRHRGWRGDRQVFFRFEVDHADDQVVGARLALVVADELVVLEA